MTIQDKVRYIEKSSGLLPKLSEDDMRAYNEIKVGTDNFNDIEDDVFNDDGRKGIDKLYNKMKEVESVSEAKKANPNVIFATMPKDETVASDKKKDKKEEKKEDKKEDKKEEKKEDKKQNPKPNPDSKSEQKSTKENKKATEEVTKQGNVAKNSNEFKVVSKFLGLRDREATRALVMSAYVSLQKMIVNQEIRKSSKHASLIVAIQGAYYDFLKGKIEKLTIPEKYLAQAIYLFQDEKRYDSVKLMSEFAGWVGKQKTEKQVKLFISKAKNALDAGKKTDPYHEELASVYKSLQSAKDGDEIVPENIGLSGLGKQFAISIIK